MKRLSIFLTALALAAPASAQSPAEIPGLRLWLDAQDASTINTSGGLVTQWNDKSGNDFHATQGDAARQPSVGAGVLNGNNAIRFDAAGGANPSDDGLAIDAGLSLGRPYTAYIVDQYWGAVQGRTLQGVTNNWLLGKWGGGNAHFTGDWVGPVGGLAAGTNAPVASEGVGTANYSQFNVNGRSLGGNIATGSPGNLHIGFSGVGGFNETSQSDVGEVIIFNRALADNERNAMARHLGSQWGLPVYQNHNATRTAAFTGADAGEGLDFQGTFIAAVNARGPGGFSIGDAVFTDDTGIITAENEILNWGGSPTGFSGSADDANLNTLMQSIRWTSTDGAGLETINASVSGLIVGTTYRLQMLFGDTIAGNNRHFAVDINGDRVIGNFALDSHVGDSTTNNLGVAVVHEFVATSMTLDIALAGTALTSPGNDRNPLLQGFTVEDRGVTGITTTGTFSNAAALDFSGNFVYAIDFNGSGGSIVGDAAFTGDSQPGVLVGAENAIPSGGWVAPDFGAGSDDVALANVMRSIRWTATNNEEKVLSVDLDVTAGQAYKLQLLFDDLGTNRGFDVSIESILVANNFALVDGNPNIGYFLTHEFTAADDQLNIVLDGFATAFGDRNPILNGLTLELIPEPSHALLSAFGFALLALRRHRKHA